MGAVWPLFGTSTTFPSAGDSHFVVNWSTFKEGADPELATFFPAMVLVIELRKFLLQDFVHQGFSRKLRFFVVFIC